MRTPKRLVPLLAVMCLGAASPAHAWFGEGWLEKLSGPGPFKGRTYDLRLLCIAGPAPSLGPTHILAPTQGTRSSPGWFATIPRRDDSWVWITPLGCHFLDRDRPRLEIGFEYSRMSSEGADNPLDYPSSVPVQDRAVNVNAFLVTADVRANRVFDVGVAAGRSTFFSPTSSSKLFRDLPKTVFTPVRVTVRPFSALTDQKRWTELFSVRVVATKFNGGFRDEEFGARPGTFREPGELVWGWAGLLDLGVLFWR